MKTISQNTDNRVSRGAQFPQVRPSPARAFATILFLTIAAASQTLVALPGSTYTTDVNGGPVNQNLYPNKEAVYLNGGPKGSGQPGLPDGMYHVKVTEPNGTLLGTTAGGPPPVQVLGGGVVGGTALNGGYQLWAILKKASDATMGYDTTTNGGGEYKAWLSMDPAFVNSASKTDNFKVANEEPPPPPPQGLVEVSKFYDADADGIFDANEEILDNWKVSIFNGTTTVDRFTTLSEQYLPGNYTVSEYMPVQSGWFATTPTSFSFALPVNGSESVVFGNLCLGAGGGKTLGFWSNKNGQATMNDGGSTLSELALLTEKNLRNANGSNFNPTTYSGFRTWILSATATNMANMLSAQYAAMVLNVESGQVSSSAIIYAPGTGSANALGYAILGDVMNEANVLLGLTGSIPSGDSARELATALKDALDRANNNLNFVQATPCPYSFEAIAP
jgi:hypothetical protein